jgi:hypothetical protein
MGGGCQVYAFAPSTLANICAQAREKSQKEKIFLAYPFRYHLLLEVRPPAQGGMRCSWNGWGRFTARPLMRCGGGAGRGAEEPGGAGGFLRGCLKNASAKLEECYEPQMNVNERRWKSDEMLRSVYISDFHPCSSFAFIHVYLTKYGYVVSSSMSAALPLRLYSSFLDF